MLEGSTFIYLHNDHLGSPALTTSGTISSTLKFYAYGKPRSSSGTQPTRYQFTGQYQDDSGLTYMNARYYDPSIGTFISADTIVPSPGNVFDYNRFMYVRGRVMNANDPSGHFTEEDIPYLCKECKTWDDVWKFFNIGGDEYLQSIFQDSSFTFGSLVFTPDGGEYTLILAQQGSSGSMSFQGAGYGLTVWDNVNDTFASMNSIIAGTFSFWGTNSLDVDTPYSFGGTYGGWLPEEAFAYKKPSQTGVNSFKDLGNVINPHGNKRYHVHRDWCVLCLAGTLISYGFASVEKIEDAADLGTNLAQDLTSRENPWIDARYPVVDANFVDLYGNSRGGLPTAK